MMGAFRLPGSDKEAILELITSRSNRQRQEICQNYKSLYGKVTVATRGQVGWGGGKLSFTCVFIQGLSGVFYSRSASVLHLCPPFLFSQSARDHAATDNTWSTC